MGILYMLNEFVSCSVPEQEATGEQPLVGDHDSPSLQLQKRPLPGKSATLLKLSW